MLLNKTITAPYQCIGKGNSFYKQGKTYQLTVAFKRRFWRNYIEVSCLRGNDNQYAGSGVIIYKDKESFDEDWKAV